MGVAKYSLCTTYVVFALGYLMHNYIEHLLVC